MKVVPIAAPAPQSPAAATRTVKMTTQPTHSAELAAIIEGTPAPAAAQPQAPTGVPASNEEKTAEATPEALSPQHLALARKEKALRKQQLEWQAERDAFKAQQSGYISKDALKADALKVLAEAGVSVEQLMQQTLNATSTVDPVQAKIDALEAKLNGYEKQQAERTSSDYQQALKVIEGDVKMLVDSDPAFETIKARGATSEVVRLIESVFEKEGVILDVSEASALVEEKLFERTLKEVEQLNNLKKIQAKRQPPAPVAEAVPAGKGPAKTLTNAMGVTRQLSARERAILAFNGQLNKN